MSFILDRAADSALAGEPGWAWPTTRRVGCTGEEYLVAAIIEQAVRDAHDMRPHHAHLRRAAERWLTGADYGPGAFEWCCAVLNLEPDVLQLYNARWRQPPKRRMRRGEAMGRAARRGMPNGW